WNAWIAARRCHVRCGADALTRIFHSPILRDSFAARSHRLRTVRNMQQDARFDGAYLALVALNWEALERSDALLADARIGWPAPAVAGRLQWLRLELLMLGECTSRCVAARQLSVEQKHRIELLVSKLLDWLDFDAATAREIVRLRLAAAQNWLLEQAG